MNLPLRVAWRHLRTRRPPRWTRAVGAAALVLVVAGASAIVWSFGQPPSEPGLELSPADLAYVIGSFAAAIGLLVFSFAATVRGFTLLVAITGYSVAQGCAALVLVLSLLGGLEGDLQRRLLGHRAHLRIAPPAGSEIVNPEPLVTRVQAVPDVVGVSPELAGPIMIRSGFGRAGVNLVGVDPALHATASGLPDEVVEGDYASFVDPSRLPRRPFPFIDAAGVVSTDDPSDMPDETGSEGPVEAPPADEHGDATTVAEASEDSGGWEDPAQEIPRLRAEGKSRRPAPRRPHRRPLPRRMTAAAGRTRSRRSRGCARRARSRPLARRSPRRPPRRRRSPSNFRLPLICRPPSPRASPSARTSRGPSRSSSASSSRPSSASAPATPYS
ncbi:hypothetical protein OV079_18005 [Nannocystis pusilla]|uniref:Uncharacterized protein n=1 Tax=Nannocystis pusilla TaxID=889268 RepID=A0A9X3IYB7_9BACT|nr:hypothetical protein [Nannocystis pusilla]MCY1007409.1 hypothetical protein [Nannocystis pusilla]